MDKDSIMLPSDLIQKEYETNPLKIIELMRKGKEKDNRSTIIEPKNKIDKIKENIIPMNDYFLYFSKKEKDNIFFCSR